MRDGQQPELRCGWRIVISPAAAHVTLFILSSGYRGLSWWSLILKALARDSILAKDKGKNTFPPLFLPKGGFLAPIESW